MPHLDCRCGLRFDLSRGPDPADYRLVPDARLDDMLALHDREIPVAQLERLDSESRQVLLCPQCGRLWLQRSPDSTGYLEYVPATE